MAAARRPSAIYRPEYQAILKMVREARHEAGMTQEEVAKALGRPLSFVSKCELGERRIDAADLMDFAKLYDKPIEYFYQLPRRRGSTKRRH